jgi:MFS family permease
VTQSSPAPAGLSSLLKAAGPSYFLVSALARLPLSMLVIGALTAVVGVSGNVAAGGAVAAIAGIGVAVGAPLSGLASDRFGQRPTLLVSAVLYVLALVAFLLAAPGATHGVTPALALAAAAAGVVVPQAGPMTRVRWIRRWAAHRDGARSLEAAQGYESTVDELSFVLGPAAVGLIAALWGGTVPLLVALVLTALFIPWFALHPTSAYGARAHAQGTPGGQAPAADPAARAAQGEPADDAAATTGDVPSAPASPQAVPWGLLGLLLLGMLSIGSVFGSLATASTAFADETGHPGTGGLLYSTLGLTSGLAALSVSRWPAKWSIQGRWLTCAALLLPALALLWLATEPWHLAVLLLLVGAPIGPVLVTVFSAAGTRTPAHRLGLVMTLLSAGITLGTSLGNWLGGELALSGGHRLALWVTFGSGVALLVAGALFAAASRRKAVAPVHAVADMHNVS